MKPSNANPSTEHAQEDPLSASPRGHSGHLPYCMEEVEPRLAEYEMQFKIKALELLHSVSPAPSSLRVLDFGCGRGEFLRMLAEAGFQCTGVDFDQNCVNLSSRWGPCFRAADATVTQVLAGKQFDVITALHVLEHLENPKQTVEDLKKLRPRSE